MDFSEFTTIDEVGEDDNNSKEENNEFYARKAWIQPTFDKIKDIPLMGLQYVVEIRKATDPSLENCSYICCLCSKKTSSTTLMAHVKSVPHRLKYTKAHMPSLYEKFGSIEVKGWTAVLVKDFTRSLKAAEVHGHKKLATANEGEITKAVAFLKASIDSNIQESSERQEKFRVERIIASAPVNDTHEKINKMLIDLTDTPNKKRTLEKSTERVSSPPLKQSRTRSPLVDSENQFGDRKRSRSRERFNDRRRSRSRSPAPKGPRRFGSPRSPLRKPLRSPPKGDRPRSPRRSWRPNERSPLRKPRPGSRSPDRRERIVGRRRSSRSPGRRFSRSPRRRSKFGGRRSSSRSPRRHNDRSSRDQKDYSHALQKLKTDLRKKLDDYMTCPESYPTYTHEWGLFWERRSRELESKGEDPQFTDFKTEWVAFWKKRLRFLCEEQFDRDQNELLIKYRITDKPKRSSDVPSHVLGLRSASPESGFKSDRRNRSERSPSPWERQPISGQNGRRTKDEQEPANVVEKDFSIVQTLRQLVDLEDQLGSLGCSVNELLRRVVDLSVKGLSEMEVFASADNKTLLRLCNTKLSSLLTAGVLGYMQATQTQMAVEALQWLQDRVRKAYPSENDKVEAQFGIDVESIARETLEMDSLGVAQHVAKHLLKIGSGDVNADDLQEILLAINAVHEKLRNKVVKTEDDMKFINIDFLTENTIGMNQMEIAHYIGQYLVNIGKLDADESMVQGILVAVAEKHVVAKLENENPKYNTDSKSKTQNRGTTLFPSGIPDSGKAESKMQSLEKDSNGKGNALSMLQDAYEDSAKDLRKLSLEALHDLLLNFRTLSSEEQKNLTNYLKKLEATDSNKVTKLRAMVQQSNKNKKQAEQKKKEAANKPVVIEPVVELRPMPEPEPKPIVSNEQSFPPGVMHPNVDNQPEIYDERRDDREFDDRNHGHNLNSSGEHDVDKERNSFVQSDRGDVVSRLFNPQIMKPEERSEVPNIINYGHGQREPDVREPDVGPFRHRGEFNSNIAFRGRPKERFSREMPEDFPRNPHFDEMQRAERDFNRDYNDPRDARPNEEEFDPRAGDEFEGGIPQRHGFPERFRDESMYDRNIDEDRFVEDGGRFGRGGPSFRPQANRGGEPRPLMDRPLAREELPFIPKFNPGRYVDEEEMGNEEIPFSREYPVEDENYEDLPMDDYSLHGRGRRGGPERGRGQFGAPDRDRGGPFRGQMGTSGIRGRDQGMPSGFRGSRGGAGAGAPSFGRGRVFTRGGMW